MLHASVPKLYALDVCFLTHACVLLLLVQVSERVKLHAWLPPGSTYPATTPIIAVECDALPCNVVLTMTHQLTMHALQLLGDPMVHDLAVALTDALESQPIDQAVAAPPPFNQPPAGVKGSGSAAVADVADYDDLAGSSEATAAAAATAEAILHRTPSMTGLAASNTSVAQHQHQHRQQQRYTRPSRSIEDVVAESRRLLHEQEKSQVCGGLGGRQCFHTSGITDDSMYMHTSYICNLCFSLCCTFVPLLAHHIN